MSFRVKVRVEEATSATQLFIFSKERLSSKARYLARAFGGSFIEARTRTIVFDDISIEDFRNFSNSILTGHLLRLPLDSMIHLYVLADRFDAQELRTAITDDLVSECFKWNFAMPSSSTITYLDDNVPKSHPLQSLLANAVAKLVYHRPVDLPCPFNNTVSEVLEKPYGICHKCYLKSISQDQVSLSECEHFFEEPADYKPERYREASHF
jgi:hypothetical protein